MSKKKLTKGRRKSRDGDSAKKVVVVTGSMSEFGILRPVMRALKDDGGFKVDLIRCEEHADGESSGADEALRKDGFRPSGSLSTKEASVGKVELSDSVRAFLSERFDDFVLGDSLFSMAKSFGIAVIMVAHGLHILQPDIVVLEGDRSETLAAAVAAAHLGIVIAHLGGGDSCLGGLDESFRHAITKLAHIHFPATEKAAERIVKMGEREDMVFMVGEPALDVALNAKLPSKKAVCEKLGLDPERDYMIVLQHPVTTQVRAAEKQMEATLRAVKDFQMQKLVLHPNKDAGSRKMIGVIEEYRKKEGFAVTQKVQHEEFLSLMKHAAVLVGNTSSGIIEAPTFRTPLVNVGQRQLGREMAGNVINVKHSMKAIREGIEKALNDKEFRRRLKQVKSPYGDGTASQKIVKELKKVLRRPKLLKELRQKKITY